MFLLSLTFSRAKGRESVCLSLLTCSWMDFATSFTIASRGVPFWPLSRHGLGPVECSESLLTRYLA